MLRTFLACGLLTLAVFPLRSARAVEEWADRELTVTDGLVFWIDAARQNAACEANGKEAKENGASVDEVFDGSGNGRNLLQADDDRQPTLRISTKATVLNFNLKDYMTHSGTEKSIPAVTAFLIAAPQSNVGNYSAFLSTRDPSVEHELSGFTLDQGLQPTGNFATLNADGHGFGDWKLTPAIENAFGDWHLIELQANPTTKIVRFGLDGRLIGSRSFNPQALRIDEILVGARYFFREDAPPRFRGFFHGQIAEVLLFERVLSAQEHEKVQQYLVNKYGGLRPQLPDNMSASASASLHTVASPPDVQVLLPGFAVKQLPVELTNINNLAYRQDGKLVALAYNGNVYLLSDSDGDNVEDKVELFWDNQGRVRSPVGMALTPPGDPQGTGLFVAAKGECSLIVDTDGDDKADKVIVVADGWPELSHGVDAVGVAVDPRDGTVYFGIGTASYTSPYLLDENGEPHYSLANERGTIMKVAPDFKSREIFCTGMRFPVALTFNREGDLFGTEQEGATWVPNGNPFDELLHLQQGRHYGFPSRHPRHLPHVIDEPSTFDYSPQHQSTCGINFNESVNGGPVFGPEWWAGNAIVSGYSRGKIWRTELVKTEAGYAARTELIGSVKMLTADACISPHGDLVVTAHTGGPDWGSGPDGMGVLYKIFYRDRETAQPSRIWPSSPQSVEIAFDRPLDTQDLKNLADRVHITYGPHVRAGDQFEIVRPGYEVVQRQLAAPRTELPVYGVQVAADRRSLILNTAPHPSAVHYAITLDDFERPKPQTGADAKPTSGELKQHSSVDLHYELTGVEANWNSGSGQTWSGWLPHLDFTIARAFTSESATHDQLWSELNDGGTLTLRTKFNLVDMLRPAVQPGSKIDFEWPEENVTIVFTSDQPIDVRTAPDSQATISAASANRVELTARPNPEVPLPVEVVLSKSAGPANLNVSYYTAEDSRPRVLQLSRLILPWATLSSPTEEQFVKRDIPELKGGNWSRGRQIFLSEKALCSKCHRIHGEGGKIGPDLSNLAHRDYASVLRDITQPSLAINPDFISYVVALADGRVLTGSVQTHGDVLQIGDEKGNVTVVNRADVEELKPTPLSTMPNDISKQLSPQQMTDLLTFVLSPPPRMPVYGSQTPPAPRTRAEVQRILSGAPQLPSTVRPLHVVLVAGKKDHKPGEHDYPDWQEMWSELMSRAENVTVTTAWEWPTEDDFRTADTIVFNQHGTWTPERAKDIDAFLKRGGGLVYIHFSVDGQENSPGLSERIGLAWQKGQSKYRHGDLDVEFTSGQHHPIARNFQKLHLHDESYWGLTGNPNEIDVLAVGEEEGVAQPLFWTVEREAGRVFASIPGHFSWTFDDPLFRALLLRGIAWTAKEPVDRFNDLVTTGARITDE